MTVQRVALGEWTPDMPSTTGTESTGLSDARNVYPNNVGYSPFPTVVAVSPEADQTLTSVYAGKENALVQVFAGSDQKLYNVYSESSPVTARALTYAGDVEVSDVSRESSPYSISPEAWHFEQFGKRVLAVKNNNVIQEWTIGSSVKFKDLTQAPTAKCMTIVRDFVVAGNIDAGDAPNLVKWSDLNNEENWTPSPQSQADSQYIADGGAIQNITGGEIGIIFLENAVYRMSYVGSPLFFQFDKISTVGCFEGKSCIEDNGISYYLSNDGFYQTDGNAVTAIGTNKVDEWFLANANLKELVTMSTTVHPTYKLVIWNYEDNFGKRQNLIYHIESGRWSRTETLANSVGNVATMGTDLERLGVLYPKLDTDVPAPLDDRIFMGGKYIFAGTSGKRVVSFTGACENPRLETLDLMGNNNSVMTMVRPLVDNGQANISIAPRQALDDTIEFGAVSVPYENRNNVRSGGRYFRVRVEPVGDNWTTAIAFDMTVTDNGIR